MPRRRIGFGTGGACVCLSVAALVLGFAGPALATDGTWERAWGKDVVTGGGIGFEICTLASSCQTGAVSTGLGGEFNGQQEIDTDAAGNVYVGDAGDERVQVFDSAGNFLRAWGKDVVVGGGTGFEICTVAANCKAGVAGAAAGELSNPIDVDVDPSGNVIVSDRGNQRIQKFDSSGNFQRMWGKDVVAGGGTGAEICTSPAFCKIGVAGSLGGELTTLRDVATDATGNVYAIEFGNTRVQKFDSTGNFQRAWGKDVVAGGGTGFEICTTAASCKAGAFDGELGGELDAPGGLAIDTAGNLSVGDADHNRIQSFDLSGNFQRAWGKDVVTGGGTGFEICTVAASCKAGAGGAALGGELGPGIQGLSTDPTGAVYVTETINQRVQQYAASGSWLRAWGKDVVTGGGTGFEICTVASDCKPGAAGALGGEFFTPVGVAANADGSVFVSDLNNRRIQKFAADPVPEPPPGGADTVAPDTTITAGPKKKQRKRKATFRFTSTEPGSSFQCKLDDRAFQPCTSPKRVRVKRGKHTFSVRATDAAGNVDATPATRSWKVKKKRKR